jgi:hypothetical protein
MNLPSIKPWIIISTRAKGCVFYAHLHIFKKENNPADFMHKLTYFENSNPLMQLIF